MFKLLLTGAWGEAACVNVTEKLGKARSPPLRESEKVPRNGHIPGRGQGFHAIRLLIQCDFGRLG